MSEKPKELREDEVAYGRSEYVRDGIKIGIKNTVCSVENISSGGKRMIRMETAKDKKNGAITQGRNANTGHSIKRNEISGEFIAGNNDKSFAGISVRKKFRAAANPSITKEMAKLAKRAVLAVLNRN